MAGSAFDKLMAGGSNPPQHNNGKSAVVTKDKGHKRGIDESEGAENLASKSKRVKQAEGSSATGKISGPSGASFLNSLSSAEIQSLARLMRKQMSPRPTTSWSTATTDRVKAFRASPDGSTHPGSWWIDLCKCELVGGSDVKDHPRWQVDIEARGSKAVVLEVEKALSVERLADFKALASAGAKKMVKLQAHHVALSADLSRRDTAPLPLNAGSGGSISHLCDRTGCVRVCHLEITPIHKKNLDRQRCRGPKLVVFQGVIVQEEPCAHAQVGLSPEARLSNSCLAHVNIVELTDGGAYAVLSILNGR